METALLKYSLPDVIQKLKNYLLEQGFIVEKMKDHHTMVAYKDGNWFHHSQHVIFEFSSIDKGFTRVDVTATIDGKKKHEEQEEIIAEKIVSKIYRNF
jgi:arginine/lysine/ornithine decarboxylase